MKKNNLYLYSVISSQIQRIKTEQAQAAAAAQEHRAQAEALSQYIKEKEAEAASLRAESKKSIDKAAELKKQAEALRAAGEDKKAQKREKQAEALSQAERERSTERAALNKNIKKLRAEKKAHKEEAEALSNDIVISNTDMTNTIKEREAEALSLFTEAEELRRKEKDINSLLNDINSSIINNYCFMDIITKHKAATNLKYDYTIYKYDYIFNRRAQELSQAAAQKEAQAQELREQAEALKYKNIPYLMDKLNRIKEAQAQAEAEELSKIKKEAEELKKKEKEAEAQRDNYFTTACNNFMEHFISYRESAAALTEAEAQELKKKNRRAQELRRKKDTYKYIIGEAQKEYTIYNNKCREAEALSQIAREAEELRREAEAQAQKKQKEAQELKEAAEKYKNVQAEELREKEAQAEALRKKTEAAEHRAQRAEREAHSINEKLKAERLKYNKYRREGREAQALKVLEKCNIYCNRYRERLSPLREYGEKAEELRKQLTEAEAQAQALREYIYSIPIKLSEAQAQAQYLRERLSKRERGSLTEAEELKEAEAQAQAVKEAEAQAERLSEIEKKYHALFVKKEAEAQALISQREAQAQAQRAERLSQKEAQAQAQAQRAERLKEKQAEALTDAIIKVYNAEELTEAEAEELRSSQAQAEALSDIKNKLYGAELLSLSQAVASAVIKKVCSAGGSASDINNTFCMLNKSSNYNFMRELKNNYYREQRAINNNNNLITCYIAYDIAQAAALRAEELTTERASLCNTNTFLFDVFKILKYNKKVYIKEAAEKEEKDCTIIQECSRAAREAIKESAAEQLCNNKYVYIEDIKTDTEEDKSTILYKRLPIYYNALVLSDIYNFNGKAERLSACDEDIKDIDYYIDLLKLSGQQITILNYMLRGYGSKAISRALNIKNENVKLQRKRIIEKIKNIPMFAERATASQKYSQAQAEALRLRRAAEKIKEYNRKEAQAEEKEKEAQALSEEAERLREELSQAEELSEIKTEAKALKACVEDVKRATLAGLLLSAERLRREAEELKTESKKYKPIKAEKEAEKEAQAAEAVAEAAQKECLKIYKKYN